MPEDDEFAEFETDEATFDAMLEQAEPAELVAPPVCVTLLSAARDAFTFRQGLPLSLGNTTSMAMGGTVQQSQIQPAPIRQQQPTERVAS